MSNYYISIDDTDTLDSIGTGEIAENLACLLEEKGYGKANQVSRHQLYFHPDIPYTSHNSAMCFELLNACIELNQLADLCGVYLDQNCALGSDPGLCIVEIEQLSDKGLLVEFGYRAKQEVLTKELAYKVANDLKIHLSEHGGTGLGVIGALAGAGLRIDGNDGRYKGKIFLGENCDNMLVKDLLTHPSIDVVQSMEGDILEENDVVFVSDRIKTIRKNSKSVLLVEKQFKSDQWYWKSVNKEKLKKY